MAGGVVPVSGGSAASIGAPLLKVLSALAVEGIVCPWSWRRMTEPLARAAAEAERSNENNMLTGSNLRRIRPMQLYVTW